MPHSIDLGDLVQDGVLGLIDAAHRFDEARGIKFETFAERRVRGAMIDALRRDAWPRGVRRVRRELEAAREQLRRELGAEPTLADLARRVGADEARLERTIVRISTIESTSPLANLETSTARRCRPCSCRASRRRRIVSTSRREVRDRVRAALASLPPRERRIIAPLLLRRSDDEADWRGDRRQRIARLAAARARDPAAAQARRHARRLADSGRSASALSSRSTALRVAPRACRDAAAVRRRKPSRRCARCGRDAA